ncbi:MAG: ABC transporter permease subunit [Phycisphaerae bacterium]
MNRGLLIKSIREALPSTVLFGVAAAAFEALLAYLIPIFYTELADQWLRLGIVENIFKGLLGADAGGPLGAGVMASIAWVHPIMLTLIWAHVIINCTRLPAEEVDRGTIDLLLALPVSRTGIYLCESVVWLGAGLGVIAMALVGSLVGSRFAAPDLRAELAPRLVVVVNLYCLYVSVGGVTCVVSALSNRRGRAIGAVFAVVLVSFLINFIAQFWHPAKSIAFLSVLNYYKPLNILRGSSWPIADMGVLLAVGAVLWFVGLLIFARRDICTV